MNKYDYEDSGWLGCGGLIAILLLVALIAASGLLSDENGARHAIEAAGMKPIDVGGYSFVACSDSDTFATRFKAKNARGEIVTGTVCSGWLKGKTIRFD